MEKEMLDLYNINEVFTGETILRSERKNISEDRFYMISAIIIENHNSELLIQKTSDNKGGKLTLTAGHVKSGEDAATCIVSEVKEELNLDIKKEDLKFVSKFKTDNQIWNVFYVKVYASDEDITILESEVKMAKFIDKSSLKKLLFSNDFDKKHKGVILDFLLKGGK